MHNLSPWLSLIFLVLSGSELSLRGDSATNVSELRVFWKDSHVWQLLRAVQHRVALLHLQEVSTKSMMAWRTIAEDLSRVSLAAGALNLYSSSSEVKEVEVVDRTVVQHSASYRRDARRYMGIYIFCMGIHIFCMGIQNGHL